MILSVEHRHPTARKRPRDLHAGGARVLATCGCEACTEDVGPEGGEEENVDPTSLLYRVSDLEREREGDGDLR